MAKTQSHSLYQGQLDTFDITVTDETGAVVDLSALTGAQLRYCVSNPGSGSLLELTLGSGVAFKTDGTDGVVTVTITALQSTAFPVATLSHAFWVNDGSTRNEPATVGHLHVLDAGC